MKIYVKGSSNNESLLNKYAGKDIWVHGYVSSSFSNGYIRIIKIYKNAIFINFIPDKYVDHFTEYPASDLELGWYGPGGRELYDAFTTISQENINQVSITSDNTITTDELIDRLTDESVRDTFKKNSRKLKRGMNWGFNISGPYGSGEWFDEDGSNWDDFDNFQFK